MIDQQYILEHLFESVAKARILRLFMQNMEQSFTIGEIAERIQLKPPVVGKEIRKLIRIDLLNERPIITQAIKKKNKTSKKKEKKPSPSSKKMLYNVNQQFPLLNELQDLVIKSYIASRKLITQEIKKLGHIKLAVISGIFVDNEKARTDILVIGDKIEKRKFDSFLLHLESELGRSLRYTSMETSEFKYRMEMYDRFLRDILEYPHEKLINKLNL